MIFISWLDMILAIAGIVLAMNDAPLPWITTIFGYFGGRAFGYILTRYRRRY